MKKIKIFRNNEKTEIRILKLLFFKRKIYNEILNYKMFFYFFISKIYEI